MTPSRRSFATRASRSCIWRTSWPRSWTPSPSCASSSSISGSIEAGIRTDMYHDIITDYIESNYPGNKDMVMKTMAGINLQELPQKDTHLLVDMVSDRCKLVCAPMPNLYFTRDPFAMIGNGVSINRMYSQTRNRETIYGDYIFKNHPDFVGTPEYYQPQRHLPHRGRRHPEHQRARAGHRHLPAHRARRHRRTSLTTSSTTRRARSTPSWRSTSRCPAPSCTSIPCSRRSTAISSPSIPASWVR